MSSFRGFFKVTTVHGYWLEEQKISLQKMDRLDITHFVEKIIMLVNGTLSRANIGSMSTFRSVRSCIMM